MIELLDSTMKNPQKEAEVTKQLSSNILRDEAIAHWGARNKIREALICRIQALIESGEDFGRVEKAIKLLEKLPNDPLLEKVLSNFT
jgi:hypothetical protein